MLAYRPISNRPTRGFVLIMALVFLLILTIIGLAAMSTTTLEEKMAGNLKERGTAFQAAETALFNAETWINTQINKPEFPSDGTTRKGLHVVSTTASSVWDTLDWSSSNVAVYPCTPYLLTGCGTGLSKVSTQPKFIIEDLAEVPEPLGPLGLTGGYDKGGGGGKLTALRITARGTGGTDNAQVMLQSTYWRAF